MCLSVMKMTQPSNLHVLGTKELMGRRLRCEQLNKIHGDNSNILAKWTEKKSIETRSISLVQSNSLLDLN